MQKSFKARLETLERLEAAQEVADPGRRLEVFLQIRPCDYFTLFAEEPLDAEAVARIDAEYGLDQVDWEHDRVQVFGGTWPGVPKAHANTIARVEVPDGYGCRIDLAPWVERDPGAPFWSVATDGDALTALRTAYRTRLLTALVERLEAGDLIVRPFNPACDLRHGANIQSTACVAVRPDAPLLDPGHPILGTVFTRFCAVLNNTLDWQQVRSGGPFAQSSTEALAILRGLGPADVWTSQQAVWPQRDKLTTQLEEQSQ